MSDDENWQQIGDLLGGIVPNLEPARDPRIAELEAQKARLINETDRLLDQLAGKMTTARNAALEEAAQPVNALAERWQLQADIAEDEGDKAGVEVMTEVAAATREIAAAIRALKDKQP
jgi:hypothetical protein